MIDPSVEERHQLTFEALNDEDPWGTILDLRITSPGWTVQRAHFYANAPVRASQRRRFLLQNTL